MELHVGDRIRDNDPRMWGRVLTIERIGVGGLFVYASDGFRKSPFRIAAKRIYRDARVRRSGFSWEPPK